MIPDTVTFTGLELDPREVLDTRLMRHPPPVTWERMQFRVPYARGGDPSLHRLNGYIGSLIEGRWFSYTFQADGGHEFVVRFEDMRDAVQFKLCDGPSAFVDHPV